MSTAPADPRSDHAPDHARPALPEGSPESPLVLLVDDDDVTALLMGHVLQGAGCAVRRVGDGRDAFDAACYAVRRPHLVIMDVQLPTMSGIQATLMLRDYERRRRLTPLPVLGCSGLRSEATHRAMLRSGMNALLLKPVEPARLLAEVGRLLHRHAGAAALPAALMSALA